MTNQIQGEILYAGVDTNPVYTPWMPARGDDATCGVELLQQKTTSLKWSVETRSLESSAVTTIVAETTVSALGADINPTTTGVKELIRYKFKTTGTASTTNYVVFRALLPSWQIDR